ncbi:MAG TPA: endonuclease/exonuclease/phosphatase family protein [Polyangia bacterium]|jgi:endonuclease/exonuclease/phosphatase family metal-dependent hydrolase
MHRRSILSFPALLLVLGLAPGCGGDPPAHGADAAVDGTPARDAPAGDAAAAGDDAAADDAAVGDDAAAVDAAAADDAPTGGDGAVVLDGGLVRLRVMAANTTSGNYQQYQTPGIHIFQGLQPDIALIQEFRYGTGAGTEAEIRALVDLAFGPSFVYYREPPAGNGDLPNGIVSRFPILAAGEWDDPQVTNRDFAWARIDIPGPIDLWAVSVHLLTSSGADRKAEAQALVAFVQAQVPAGDYLVIGGDFNTDDRAEQCWTTLAAIVDTGAPYPVDQNGNSFTSANRSKPYDWVIADPDLRPHQIPVVLGASTFPAGLVVDSRVYTPLGEIAPVIASDSSASSMQHMAVVKDFAIPP